MPKRTIVLANDEGEGKEAQWFPVYADDWYTETKEGDISLEALADLCDGEAESRNNHEYVGAHRILAALFHQKLGREQATSLMREIAEYGGLDGMTGAGGEDDAFADFGIKDCWRDWSLPI